MGCGCILSVWMAFRPPLLPVLDHSIARIKCAFEWTKEGSVWGSDGHLRDRYPRLPWLIDVVFVVGVGCGLWLIYDGVWDKIIIGKIGTVR